MLPIFSVALALVLVRLSPAAGEVETLILRVVAAASTMLMMCQR
jgi:hypothetical protein